MPLHEVTGDLFGLDLPALGHGCNCQGAMGAGVAKEFRRRFPQMYAGYRRRCLDATFTLGDVWAWEADSLVIYNLGTQPRPGPSASLAAIESSVRRMLIDAHERGLPAVGVPRIGAGLGGLAWPSVHRVLALLGEESPVALTVVSLPEAGEG